MKALTICQPYAHLIVQGKKRVENRTWPTKYRGLFYVHAGKSREWLLPWKDDLGNEWCKVDGGEILVGNMAFGAVVAIANLVDCILHKQIENAEWDEKYPWIRSHEHASGPWCWVLDDVTPIGPWPWKGAQGLFNIDDKALDEVANRVIGSNV